jgi:hypothetical protein
MIRLVRAEFSKLWDTPTTWLLFGAALALVAASTILSLALGPVRSVENQRVLVGFASTAGLVALVAGVVSAAGEYRHHTIIPAVLLTPGRAPLVAAQAVTYAAGGAAAGLAAAALNTLIVIVGVPIRGAHVGVPVGQIAVVTIGAVIYTALSAASGVGLGALARNQVAAVAGVLVFVSLLDPAISALAPALGKFGPSALGIAFSDSGAASNGPFSQILPLWAATVAYQSYVAFFLIVGTIASLRREIR